MLSGVEEKGSGKAAAAKGAQDEDSALVCSGGRRGANEAAGGAAHYLYTEPARARPGPRPSAPRATAPLARG